MDDFQRGDRVKVKATIYDHWDDFTGTIVAFYDNDEVEVKDDNGGYVVLAYVNQLTPI